MRRFPVRCHILLALLPLAATLSSAEPLLSSDFAAASGSATIIIPGTSTGTRTGLQVAVGDRVSISGNGGVNTLPPNPGNLASPAGNGAACLSSCLLPSTNFGALIGKIGNGGSWFPVGFQADFVAGRSGELILAVNDNIHDNNTGSFVAAAVIQAPTAVCAPGPSTLCLSRGRFRLELTWRTGDGHTGLGSVAPCGTTDSGLIWFFDSSNWEMLVKIVDGCALNNRYWVFFAATTNVEFTLRVTDTLTGSVKQYSNPLNHLASPVADTSAFACS
jgi:hypothetical protein